MVSAASRTAGSAAPGPLSIALRVTFTRSMSRAITTLNLNDSMSPGASARKRCVACRTVRSPVDQTASGVEVTSTAIR